MRRLSLRGLMPVIGIVLCGLSLSAQSTIHELKLEPEKLEAVEGKAYLFAVPYTVPVANIVSSSNAAVNASQGKVAIYVYDGPKRAVGLDPWVAVGTGSELVAGKCYKMVLNGTTQNTWKCQPTGTPTESKSVTISKNTGSSPVLSGWNGVANTAWSKASATLDGVSYAYIYDNGNGVYALENLDRTWDVGEPMIVQSPVAGKMTFTKSGVGFDFGGNMKPGEEFDAPSRKTASETYNLVISPLNDGYTDKMDLTFQTEDKDGYVIGKDLAKLHGEGTGVLQIWMEAYGTDLSVHTAVLTDGRAVIPVHIYAPATDDYVLTAGGGDVSQFTLVHNGAYQTKSINYWRIRLTKGENILTLQYGFPTPTGIDESNTERRSKKVMRDGRLFILRDGQWFNALGEQTTEN